MNRFFDDKTADSLKGRDCAIVLGGFMNPLGIIRSLGVDSSIILVSLTPRNSTAGSSKYVTHRIEYDIEEEIVEVLLLLDGICNSIVPFPTTDTLYLLLLEARDEFRNCLLYTSPSPRDQRGSRMPSSA